MPTHHAHETFWMVNAFSWFTILAGACSLMQLLTAIDCPIGHKTTVVMGGWGSQCGLASCQMIHSWLYLLLREKYTHCRMRTVSAACCHPDKLWCQESYVGVSVWCRWEMVYSLMSGHHLPTLILQSNEDNGSEGKGWLIPDQSPRPYHYNWHVHQAQYLHLQAGSWPLKDLHYLQHWGLDLILWVLQIFP